MKFRGQDGLFLIDEDLVESKFTFDGEPAGFSSHYTAWSGLKGAFALTIFLKINPFMRNPYLERYFPYFSKFWTLLGGFWSLLNGICHSEFNRSCSNFLALKMFLKNCLKIDIQV